MNSNLSKMIRMRFFGDSGSNIVYVTAGLAVMSIVGMSAAFLVGDVKKQEVASQIMASLNQAHVLHLQKIKNSETIKRALGEAGFSVAPDTNNYKCLAGQGTSCQLLCLGACQSEALEYKTLSSFTETSAVGGGFQVVSTGEYAFYCPTSTACEFVSVKVKSQVQQLGGSQNVYSKISRNSEFRIAGLFLTDRAQINFNCATSGNIPTGIDLKKLGAICEPQQSQPANCGGVAVAAATAPIANYNIHSANQSCVAVNSLNCVAAGVASLGAFSGSCVGAAPPVTTTTLVAGTTTTAGATTTTGGGTTTTTSGGGTTTTGGGTTTTATIIACAGSTIPLCASAMSSPFATPSCVLISTGATIPEQPYVQDATACGYTCLPGVRGIACDRIFGTCSWRKRRCSNYRYWKDEAGTQQTSSVVDAYKWIQSDIDRPDCLDKCLNSYSVCLANPSASYNSDCELQTLWAP